MQKFALILVSAGKGRRLGKNIDKAVLNIARYPLFYYTLKKFLGIKQIKEIILVLRKKNFNIAKRLTSSIKNVNIKIVEGGKERQDSVKEGLKYVSNDIEYVLIHDAARPFVNRGLIKNIIKELKYFDAVICGVPAKDTLKIVKDGFVFSTLDREKIFYIQTPQGFRKSLIIDAYKNLGNKTVFDDSQAVEFMGKKVKVIESDYLNFKITYPEDIILANKIAVAKII